MYANLHEDRSSGLACASDTYTHTDKQKWQGSSWGNTIAGLPYQFGQISKK